MKECDAIAAKALGDCNIDTRARLTAVLFEHCLNGRINLNTLEPGTEKPA